MQMTDIYIPGLRNGLYCYNPGVMYASVTDISADEVMLSPLFLVCLSVCPTVSCSKILGEFDNCYVDSMNKQQYCWLGGTTGSASDQRSEGCGFEAY